MVVVLMSELNEWLRNLPLEQRAETMALNNETETSIKQSHLERAWPVLIKRRLPAQAESILADMVAEYKFTNSRKWKFDFAWPELKIAVELHGISDSSGGGGRHLRPIGFTNDREKMNDAGIQGWIILEITTISLKSNIPFLQLLRAFEARGVEFE